MSDIDNVRACAPFPSHFVNVLGSNLHYVDEGAGDPILFLHGNGCSSYIWRNIIPHMKSTGRCIALDLVGMGMSDKPDIAYRFVDHVRYVEGFIDAMKLRNITLVLHDWGAPLGFHYAMRNQDNIKGLAFFADAMLTPIRGWDQFLPEHKALFQAFRSPDTGWDMAVNQNMFMEKVIPAGIARKLSKEEMDCYLAPFRDPGSRKPLAQWPKELPIEGDPADVTRLVEEYGVALEHSDLPKLLMYATLPQQLRAVPMSGIVNALADAKTNPVVDWCESHLKGLTVKNIGVGIHYVQEDNPQAISNALHEWYADRISIR